MFSLVYTWAQIYCQNDGEIGCERISLRTEHYGQVEEKDDGQKPTDLVLDESGIGIGDL